MGPLHTQRCQQCRSDSSGLDDKQARQLLGSIPGWQMEQRDGVYRLIKSYNFDSFKAAFEFAQKVAGIAEQEDHHPLITVEWG